MQTFKRAVQPRGKSKADWQIVAELMTRLGKPAVLLATGHCP